MISNYAVIAFVVIVGVFFVLPAVLDRVLSGTWFGRTFFRLWVAMIGTVIVAGWLADKFFGYH